MQLYQGEDTVGWTDLLVPPTTERNVLFIILFIQATLSLVGEEAVRHLLVHAAPHKNNNNEKHTCLSFA